MEADLLLVNVGQLAGVTRSDKRPRRAASAADFAVLSNASLAVHKEQVVWIGPSNELPAVNTGCTIHDVRGRVVIPGLVDSHTHLIYAGDRVEEFEWRLAGASYSEIAGRGGGINTTVRAVRAASNADLANQTRRRLQRCLANGVTTVEIKTGYGLDTANELRCLDVIAQLDREGPCELVATFLGRM